jgi:D-inositol-3-phosphate glycosyltransferase
VNQLVRWEHGLADVRELFAAVDLVCVPSQREPFGRTAVEGMLARKIVLASAVDGLAEIVEPGETGFLIDAHDVAAWTRALRNAAGDSEMRRRMGEAARRHALNHFSVDSACARIVELLQTLLHGRYVDRRAQAL